MGKIIVGLHPGARLRMKEVLSTPRCFCTRCPQSYRAETGADIETAGSDDASEREYLASKRGRAVEHTGVLRGVVKQYGDDRVYVAEVFGMDSVTKIGYAHSASCCHAAL